MIQIIAGTFGYYNGRKVVPITNADGPQKFDPELEARLVKQGVAKYVDEQPVAPAPAAKPEQEPETAPETVRVTEPLVRVTTTFPLAAARPAGTVTVTR